MLCLERLRPPKAPCGNGTEALHTLLSRLCCFLRKKFKSSLTKLRQICWYAIYQFFPSVGRKWHEIRNTEILHESCWFWQNREIRWAPQRDTYEISRPLLQKSTSPLPHLLQFDVLLRKQAGCLVLRMSADVRGITWSIVIRVDRSFISSKA